MLFGAMSSGICSRNPRRLTVWDEPKVGPTFLKLTCASLRLEEKFGLFFPEHSNNNTRIIIHNNSYQVLKKVIFVELEQGLSFSPFSRA